MSDTPTQMLPDHPDHHRHSAAPVKSNTTRNVVIGLAIALFVVLVSVIIWLLFFRDNPAPGPTPTPTPTQSSATPSPSPTVSPPPLTPQSCNTDNSNATLGTPDGAAGSTVVPIIFTNTGTAPCTLEGYPTVEFVGDGDGTQVGDAATQDTTTSPVQVITIEPGNSATSMLTVTTAGNVCEPVDVDGFRIIPPGSSDAFFIEADGYQACPTGSIMTVSAVNTN